MKPTQILTEEHKHIARMLKITNRVCVTLSEKADVNSDDLKKIVAFFKTFADSCHHFKEETILFKELEVNGMSSDSGPLATMKQEHEIGRHYISKMSEAADLYEKDKNSAVVSFLDNANKYISLLHQHIYKEDNILFPMANNRLSPEQQESLLERFKSVEHEHIGEGVHEKFLKILDEMEEKYLVQKQS